MASPFPVLRSYSGRQLDRIAFPLGGVGTGCVSLNGRGGLQDFECVNRPAKGFTPDPVFFAIRVEGKGGASTKVLEGPLPDGLYQGPTGSEAPAHNLPRFGAARFDAAWPLATVHLTDAEVPLRVRLEAFGAMTPPDAGACEYPVASLRWVLRNPTKKPIRASVVASLRNFIGADGSSPKPRWGGYPDHAHHWKRNRNTYVEGRGVRGLRMHSEGQEPTAETWGTLALATTAHEGVSWRTSWGPAQWGGDLLDFWDDFSADGTLDDREVGGAQGPVGSLCVSVTVPAGGEVAVPFLLAWHFPNRQTWTKRQTPDDRVGNHYCTRFDDAFEAAESFAADAGELERRTRTFVGAVLSADVPEVVKEACLFNLSTLVSQTCFRTEDGHFFGWEGCHPHEGSCMGSCTHVWNYEAALPQLFGAIARDQRAIEFGHATDARGLMSFRIHLPLSRATEFNIAAADGQMGCVVRLYREFRTSGDPGFLKSLYPGMKRAMEFAWIPGGWDADRDGMMEGCQHNTMDVEYYGPNPQMQAWYLAALLAASEMATAVGDHAFAEQCSRLFVSGSAKTDETLFNGEYYEQLVMPPGKRKIADGLKAGMGSGDVNDPQLQLGAGCLVDQLAGQYVAHQAGLGHVLDEEHVRATLGSVYAHNFKRSLSGHFNHLRSFALGDEAGTLMCSYPRGRRPRQPFPYYNECMTGFEYCAAVGMIQEGMVDEGLELIGAVRARHTGERRNPFDEPECGHHYARAMAVWAAIPALQRTDYDGRSGTLTLDPPAGMDRVFFATGDAYGTAELSAKGLTLKVLAGHLKLETLVARGKGHHVGLTLIAPYELRVEERGARKVGARKRAVARKR